MRRAGVLALLAWLTTGCFTGSYLAQAAAGQDELSWRRRPVDEVVGDPRTPEHTRRLLALVEDVKRYGERNHLDPTDNYREYVDVDGPAVVWVVSAAAPLSFAQKTWWFPIVGNVPYLGWFDRRDAERHADRLRRAGWDVDLRGASAYSTLGFFDDPILSTMIRPRLGTVGGLVNVVIHESVHATHYVPGQTLFNESLADFVADRLTAVYLRRRLQLSRWQIWAYEEGQVRGAQRAREFFDAYRTLETVYASALPEATKLEIKTRVTDLVREKWGFSRPINNATLAQSRSYNGGIPVFAELLAHCDEDWGRFWAAVERIDTSSFDGPQQRDIDPVLRAVMTTPCPHRRPP
ncbi:MAG: aminopeptidase [Myxococcota bacterium]